METLVVESPEPFSLSLLEKSISPYWRVDMSFDEPRLAIHGPGTRAYVYLEDEQEVDGYHRLFVDYSDVAFLKALAPLIADDPTFTVDNDFGTVLPGDEFVAKCQREKGWDWREESRRSSG